ncbi:MAG: resuscitation-promoting factor RpfB [Actinomycetota bacterium]|nr:resuscitation-promoting factor RpfB [Actinomycetota bacterium]
MPRPPNGRVGGSAGAAEHRVARHRIALALSRSTSFTRATALACVIALALAGVPAIAAAQASSTSLSGLRASIDATANEWFAAQARSDNLDRQVELLSRTLSEEEQRVARIRGIADKRAVQIYEDSTQGFGTMFGKDPLEIGRRAALIGQANSESQKAIDALSTSVADLTARRNDLDRARADLAKTLHELESHRASLDAQLAKLQVQSASAADRTLLAAEIGRTHTALAQDSNGATATATPATATQRVTATPVALAPPSNVGRVSSHHDDPFLVCTRARESAGDYQVVSSSGYYGAYQFAPTTWDVAASHAGRLDLVGVLPSVASEYDQDEIAWVLYQWQGNAPWGGRC